MNQLAQNLTKLLNIMSQYENDGRMAEAEIAHNTLVRLAQQQAAGSAYGGFTMPQNMPPEIGLYFSNIFSQLQQLQTGLGALKTQVNAPAAAKPPAAQAVDPNAPGTMNIMPVGGASAMQSVPNSAAPVQISGDAEVSV